MTTPHGSEQRQPRSIVGTVVGTAVAALLVGGGIAAGVLGHQLAAAHAETAAARSALADQQAQGAQVDDVRSCVSKTLSDASDQVEAMSGSAGDILNAMVDYLSGNSTQDDLTSTAALSASDHDDEYSAAQDSIDAAVKC